jgi:hypothetical protein
MTSTRSRAELWARIGITVQFLALVRTLGEVFRLNYVRGGGLTFADARPYVVGAVIAAVLCWMAVSLYFFRRFRLTIAVAAATVVVLLAYKLYALGT